MAEVSASASESDGKLGPDEAKTDGRTRRPLLTAAGREAGGGVMARTWTIRLPVRAEQVTLTKPVVVREAVTIRVHPTTEMVTIGSDVRREELHLTKSGKPVVHDDDAHPGAPRGDG
jgi:hypothetical protein